MATPADPLMVKFGPPLRIGDKDDGLAYYVFNPEGTESILLLHGAMTGGPEWDLVIPYFSEQYHLLVPDIPLHNNSKDMKLENGGIETGNILRDLVKSAAKDGQAHLVGMSMGAHLGRRLAVQHAEVVKTCFLSGYKRFDLLPFKNYLPYIVAAVETIGSKIPKSWMDGIEHTTDITTPHDFTHFKKVWTMVTDDEDVRDKPWKARTLVVAASKGGLIPTNDSTKDASELALLAQQENPESMAVQNKTMRHGWIRQDPKLVAEAAMCWIEKKPLPEGFEPI
jgi:pimeloyl-ACP methyl ester carboxylesterase